MAMADGELLDGHVRAWELAYGCVASMAATAACQLGIPDLLASTQDGLTAQQLAHHLGGDAPRHANELDRMMRLLCTHGVFALLHVDSTSPSPPRYTLTAVSRWLCQAAAGSSDSVYPYLRMFTSPPFLAAWEHLPARILQGANPFQSAHENMSVWSFAAAHPDFNQTFNAAMACSTRLSVKALLHFYQGFADTHTLVDVAGGVGTAVSCIVQHYPHINGINFDLHHVVATAPTLQGVQHIGGDMFESIPSCDTIFMKWILHDWEDEDCIKILRNCHKALSNGGKLIIMDALLMDYNSCAKHPYNKVRMDLDMAMMVYTEGKERTRLQLESILQASGFLCSRIFDIPCMECIIEAFPTMQNL